MSMVGWMGESEGPVLSEDTSTLFTAPPVSSETKEMSAVFRDNSNVEDR